MDAVMLRPTAKEGKYVVSLTVFRKVQAKNVKRYFYPSYKEGYIYRLEN